MPQFATLRPLDVSGHGLDIGYQRLGSDGGSSPIPLSAEALAQNNAIMRFADLLETHPCELPDPKEFELDKFDDVGLLSGMVRAARLNEEHPLSPPEEWEAASEMSDDSAGTFSTASSPSVELFPDETPGLPLSTAGTSPSLSLASGKEGFPFNYDDRAKDEPDDVLDSDVESEGSSGSLSVYSLETMKPLEYLTTHTSFPATLPKGHPHIVRTDNFDEDVDATNLTLADGVATFLSLWNWPDLSVFFDKGKDGEFKEKEYWVHVKSKTRTRWGWDKDIVIGRRQHDVLAGLRNRKGEYENFVTFSIDDDGKWIPFSSTGKYRFGNRLKNVEKEGAFIASSILMYRRWDRNRNDIASCTGAGEGS